MDGSALLDSNIAIRILNGDPSTRSQIASIDQTYLPCVVVGELAFGAYKSTRVEQNLQRIQEFISNSVVLSIELDTAFFYGRLKRQLRGTGRPIPENDLWIAALALQHGLTLISGDRHFANIEGLTLQLWK